MTKDFTLLSSQTRRPSIVRSPRKATLDFIRQFAESYTYLNGKTLKIWRASVVGQEDADKGKEGLVQLQEPEGAEQMEPGCIVEVTKDSLTVQTGQGRLQLLEVQLEGKKRMSVDAFLRGFQIEAGCRLGKE